MQKKASNSKINRAKKQVVQKTATFKPIKVDTSRLTPAQWTLPASLAERFPFDKPKKRRDYTPVKVVRRNFVLKRMPFEYLVGSDSKTFNEASKFCK